MQRLGCVFSCRPATMPAWRGLPASPSLYLPSMPACSAAHAGYPRGPPCIIHNSIDINGILKPFSTQENKMKCQLPWTQALTETWGYNLFIVGCMTACHFFQSINLPQNQTIISQNTRINHILHLDDTVFRELTIFCRIYQKRPLSPSNSSPKTYIKEGKQQVRHGTPCASLSLQETTVLSPYKTHRAQHGTHF